MSQTFDINSLLAELDEAHAELNRRKLGQFSKSVTFGDANLIKFEYDETMPPEITKPHLNQQLNNSTKSILKESSVDISPDILPLAPEDVNVNDGNWDISSEDSNNNKEIEQYDEFDDDNTPLGLTFSRLSRESVGGYSHILDDYDYDSDSDYKSSMEQFKSPVTFYGQMINSGTVENFNQSESPVSVPLEKQSSIDATEQLSLSISTNIVKKLDSESKLNETSNENLIETKVYLPELKLFKVVYRKPRDTALDLLQELCVNLVPGPWTIMEHYSQIGLERPIRDWEVISDVIASWEDLNKSSLIARRYELRDTLCLLYLKKKLPRIQGTLEFETKSGKWKKKFFFVKDHSFYYYEKESSKTPTLLCNLALYDVFEWTRKPKNAPTGIGFTLKSDSKQSYFMDKSQYLFQFCVEKSERLNDWIQVLRLIKGIAMQMKKTPKTIDDDNTPLGSNPLFNIASNSLITPGSLLDKLENGSSKKSSELKKSSSNSGKKPLVDISGATICKTCQCTEFVSKPSAEYCRVCHHLHI